MGNEVSNGTIQLSGIGCFGDPAPVELDPDTTEINVVTPIVGDALRSGFQWPASCTSDGGWDTGFATVEFRCARGRLHFGDRSWSGGQLRPSRIDYLVAFPTPPKPRRRSDCGGASSSGPEFKTSPPTTFHV